MARGIRRVPSCNLKSERRMGRIIYMVTLLSPRVQHVRYTPLTCLDVV